MGSRDFFQPGDWNAVCSMCGRKRKASELVRNWQGLYRCKEHNEARHPQDFVRGVRESLGVPWAQPYIDLDLHFCTIWGISSVPGYSEPGCMMPGAQTPAKERLMDPPSLCTYFTTWAMPGYGGPGCLMPGQDTLN